MPFAHFSVPRHGPGGAGGELPRVHQGESPAFILHGFLFYLQAEPLKKKAIFFFQLEGRSLDIKCHMVQRDRQMVINRVTTMEEVKGNCVIG